MKHAEPSFEKQEKDNAPDTGHEWEKGTLCAEEEKVLEPVAARVALAERSAEKKRLPRWKQAMLAGLTALAFADVSFAAPRAHGGEKGEDEARIEEVAPEKEKKENERKVEKLRKGIENPEFKAKVAQLEAEYGDAVEPLFFFMKFNLRDLESLPTATDESLKAYLTQSLAKYYDLFWNKEKIIERANGHEVDIDLRDYREAPASPDDVSAGIHRFDYKGKAAKLEQLIKKLPPEITGNVDEICVYPTKVLRSHYEVWGNADNVGLQSMLWRDSNNGNRMNIYEGGGETTVGLLAHEFAHFNDWEVGNRLTMEERVDFLMEITKRLKADDRIRTDYLDNKIPAEYRDNGWSKKEMQYRLATEYWGEAVGLYTWGGKKASGKVLRNIYPEDNRFVEKWIKVLGEGR